jgi:uridine kinase
VAAFESVSTWRQPEPPIASAVRSGLISGLAGQIGRLSRGRLRVAVDGFTAAGKTSFGHELAAAIRRLGRPTLRASLDDFKNPWREARELGYDRVTGEGYYRNAYDFRAATELLLGPAGPAGSGQVVLCAHDPLTGEDHRDKVVLAPADAVLVVDSVFRAPARVQRSLGIPYLARHRCRRGAGAGHRPRRGHGGPWRSGPASP